MSDQSFYDTPAQVAAATDGRRLRGYRVTSSIDVEAGAPAEAARQAHAILRRGGPTAVDVEWTDTLRRPAGAEITSRLRVTPDQLHTVDHPRLPAGDIGADVPRLPAIGIDAAQATAWLTEPNLRDPARTNAQCCGVVMSPPLSWSVPDFLTRAGSVLAAASYAKIFGADIELQLYLGSGPDNSDGALLLVTIDTIDSRPPLRLTSHHLEPSDLIWDTHDIGQAAAVGVLRAAASIADDLVLRVRQVLFAAAFPPRLSGPGGYTCAACRDLRWLVIAVNGDSSQAWVQRCDDCSRDLLDDHDAADLAAAQMGTAVAHGVAGHPGHGRPYLAGIPFADAQARWVRLAGLAGQSAAGPLRDQP